MKKILYIVIAVVLGATSCSDDFLNRTPMGQWHHGNYTPDNEIDKSILVQGKLLQAYSDLRSWGFCWNALAMQNYTTPDVEKGSTPTDGGTVAEFKSMSFNASNGSIKDYWNINYSTIYKTNEALVLARAMSDTVPGKNGFIAEALFVRSLIYFRLVQSFGGVPYVDRILDQTEKTPARSSAEEIYAQIETDLLWCIGQLPTRQQLVTSGNVGRATQNAARAVLAKAYLYQKNWGGAMGQTAAIIASGDNDITTPFNEIFTENKEYCSESVLEIFADERPDDKVYMGSQWGQIQGFRGVPDMGWGFNCPSAALMAAFEEGDPRYAATVIENGQTIDGTRMKADPAAYQFFNRKAFVTKAEYTRYGRSLSLQGNWINIRVIRYSDILLMHAEAACEMENIDEALEKLEMVRNRARGGNSAVLPRVTERDPNLLMAKIRHERRIELALEFERYFDLVRWGEAKKAIGDKFVVGKHELFPIPQEEIDKSEGLITQNPNYN